MNEVLNNMSYNGYTIDFLKELVTISFDEYVQRRISYIGNVKNGLYYSGMKNDSSAISKYDSIAPHQRKKPFETKCETKVHTNKYFALYT